jgi:hypothetical protein
VFKEALLHVTGQAFEAAGYELVGDAVQEAAGLFRFRRPLGEGWYAFIEFQLLLYRDTPATRFRVNLARSHGLSPKAGRKVGSEREKTDAKGAKEGSAKGEPGALNAPLTQVLWHVYGLRDYPDPEYWWEFTSYPELAQALADAGRNALTYGRVWLEDPESTF